MNIAESLMFRPQPTPGSNGRLLWNPLQVWRFVFKPVEFLTESKERYGNPFYMRIPQLPLFYFFSDARSAKRVFTDNSGALTAGASNAILEPVVGMQSLLTLDGPRHLRERKMLLPPFHGDRMKSYAETMHEAAVRGSQQWGDAATVPVHEVLQNITLDVILRAVFGVEGEAKELLRTRVVDLLAASATPMMLLPVLSLNWGKSSPQARFLRARKLVDESIYDEIRRRRQSRERGDDICSMLLDATYEDGEPIGDSGVRDELVTMLVAGHETSATALAWCLDRMALHPDWQDRLRQEASGLRDDDPWSVNAESVPLLDAFIKETMRLHPILPAVGRMANWDVEVGGVVVPKGAIAGLSTVLTHRNPQHWPQPLAFRPERFLDSKPNPYAYFPFGGGIRRCIGMAFAMYEIRIVLAALLRRFAFSKKGSEPAITTRRMITLSPKDGAPLRVERLQ